MEYNCIIRNPGPQFLIHLICPGKVRCRRYAYMGTENHGNRDQQFSGIYKQPWMPESADDLMYRFRLMSNSKEIVIPLNFFYFKKFHII